MVSLNFYPLDIDYQIENDIPYILLFGRTLKGNKICVKTEFYPYFWVIKKENTLDSLKNIKEIEIKSLEECTKVLEGKEISVIKVTLQTPDMVPKLRTLFEEMKIDFLEADILYVRRYLIDNEIIMFHEYVVEGEETTPFPHCTCVISSQIVQGESTYDNPKILALDIETYPDEIKGRKNPILMVAFSSETYKKVLTWKKIPKILGKDYIEVVDGEAELLERVKQIIDDQDPDIITGYFSDGFDLPYINERAKKYKVKMNLGVDNSPMRFGRGSKDEVSIRGILHIDVLSFTKNVLRQSLKTDSLSLGNVAQELLGDTKKDIDILDLAPAWDENDKSKLVEFAEYNLHDADLTLKLCTKLLPNLIEMVKIVGIPAFDVSRLALSQMVEWYLIKNAPKYNNLVPNKPSRHEVKERQFNVMKGAFVFEPEPGLYNNILLFDFRSLYPTIIASHNLSGATFRCECCKNSATKIPVPEEHDKDGQGFWFCQKRKGFLPLMIEDLINRRKRVKDIMKEKGTPFLDARQGGLKLLANSFYGYLAFNYSRWYSFESGDSTTAMARFYIKNAIEEMEKEKLRVIYGDTDSIFISVKDDVEKKRAMKVMGKINENLPGIMELEFEGNYPSGIFVSPRDGKGGAKKRYALIDDEDNLIIKGFESVRRNTSFIAKQVQRKVLGIVLKENNPEKAFEYVRNIVKKSRDKSLPISDFVIKTRLSKDISNYDAIGPHVEIAKKMLADGKHVSAGSIISYVICEGQGIIRDRAKLLNETSKEEIDAEYYINNQILPVVEKIFEVLGYRVEDIVEDHSQSKLKSYFS
jgi:DNA polymerase, archaea type